MMGGMGYTVEGGMEAMLRMALPQTIAGEQRDPAGDHRQDAGL